MSGQPYTPDEFNVRMVWVTTGIGPDDDLNAEFDRFVAKVKADALREAAATDDQDHYTEVALGGGDYVRDWLNARADRIENGDDR